MRSISIYVQTTNEMREFSSDAKTWGEIRKDVPEFQAGMKAIVAEGRIGLVSDETSLPEGNITIHLTPSKVKSGIVTLTEEETQVYVNKVESLFSSLSLVVTNN